jgi:hypothetical protein
MGKGEEAALLVASPFYSLSIIVSHAEQNIRMKRERHVLSELTLTERRKISLYTESDF